MDPQHADTPQERERTVEAVATFAALMHAYERADLRKSIELIDHLRQQGVAVRFFRPIVKSGKGAANVNVR